MRGIFHATEGTVRSVGAENRIGNLDTTNWNVSLLKGDTRSVTHWYNWKASRDSEDSHALYGTVTWEH